MNHYNDKDLWNLIKRGDKKAFDFVYQKHIRSLYFFGYKICANKTLVEDCIQEVFLSLWKSRRNINIRQSIRAYLLHALRHSLIRRLKADKKTMDFSDKEPTLGSFDIQLPVEAHWIAAEVKAQNTLRLKQALEQLSNREKEAIYLKYYENISYEEIATIMGISQRAVYKVVHSGIKKLRRLLN